MQYDFSHVLTIFYLITVVRPGSEFHKACLLIKWKVSHIDFTWRFENCRRCPVNAASVVEYGFCQGSYHILAVGTRIRLMKIEQSSFRHSLSSKRVFINSVPLRYPYRKRTNNNLICWPIRLHFMVIEYRNVDYRLPSSNKLHFFDRESYRLEWIKQSA